MAGWGLKLPNLSILCPDYWGRKEMRKQNAAPHWIAVDSCAGGMRAWAMDQNGTVLMKVRSAQGLAQVAVDAFEIVLLNLVRPWLIREQTPVIVSGLPGPVPETVGTSRRPADAPIRPVATSDDRLTLHALPRLGAAKGPEKTLSHHGLIRGIAAERPAFNGAICIPDLQTQWVQIHAGEVRKVQLFMTLELFDLLAPQGERVGVVSEPALDMGAFHGAVSEALNQPEMMAQRLLSARSDNDPAKARLKGVLIGMELASARAAWQGKQVMIVNSSPWSSLYEQALSGQGVAVQTCDSDTMTLAGLKHAYRSLCETFA